MRPPRLTTKMGKATVDKLEKLKKEEIEKEKELMKKIRELKMNQGLSRREKAGEKTQPAPKKRRTGKEEYKRVHQDERKPEKRSEDEVKKEKETYFPIFKKMKITEEKEVSKTEKQVCKHHGCISSTSVYIRSPKPPL